MKDQVLREVNSTMGNWVLMKFTQENNIIVENELYTED